MPINDNYNFPDCISVGTPSDAFLDGYTPVEAQDPQPEYYGIGCTEADRIIKDNAAWLQAKPRTALEIIAALFPGSMRRMKDYLEVATFIGGFLWEAGYTPQYVDPLYPTWYWLEGAEHAPLDSFQEEEGGFDLLSEAQFLNFLDGDGSYPLAA